MLHLSHIDAGAVVAGELLAAPAGGEGEQVV